MLSVPNRFEYTLYFVSPPSFVREAILSALVNQQAMRVIGSSDEPAQIVADCERLSPQVVVIETDIGIEKVFEVLSLLRETSPHSLPIVLGREFRDRLLEVLLRCPIRGVLLQSENLRSLATAVREVAAGRFVLSEALRSRVRPAPSSSGFEIVSKSPISQMTPEQIELLLEIAQGYSVKEMARRLNKTEKAIDGQKYRLMRRLDISDRVHLTRYAIREGLIDP